MAGKDAEKSTANSAQSDIQGAIRMGQEAAKTAKTVSRVAAQAATGNYAGAAVTLAKDPATIRKILLVVLSPLLFIALLMVFFLHALPTLVYEAVVSFFSELAEQWTQDTYGGGGGVLWGGVMATIGAAGRVTGDLAESVWRGLKNFFTAGEGNVDDGSDILSEGGVELYVTQAEEAQKETLERKIDSAIMKVDVRANALYDEVQSNAQAIRNYFYNKYASTCDEWHTNVDVQIMPISRPEAVKLLSIYTVMTDASTEELRLSDFVRWLGYYNELTLSRTTFDLGGQGIRGSVKTWKGTFMPQYLLEQRQYELEVFGREVTDFSQYQCSVVDMLLVVDCPNFLTLQPQYHVETRVVGDEVVQVLVGSITVPILIRARSIDLFSNEAIGFWDGALPAAS